MIKRHEIDFTTGTLLGKMIQYALPIIGVNVLQLLFTAADLSILGIFTGKDNAIAAVGASTPIINLMIGFFTGLSLGANVLIARCVGSHNSEKAKKYVGTSIFVSLVFGFVIMIIGVLLAETMLIWTNCDANVLPYATAYLRIYFLGMPIIMLYNFCSAILRAVGDTLRPLIFLVVGGLINIVLNIFFVVVVKLDVEGVAIATVASNGVSGFASLYIMLKNDGYAKIDKESFKFFGKEFLEIFQIGLPVALSKCLFSFSNVIVTTELNALGEHAMAANSITKEFDGFIMEACHGIGAATLAVVSQNYGAKKPERMRRVMWLSILMEIVLCGALSLVLLFFGRTLCGIMTDTKAVLDLCVVRIQTMSVFYIVLGILNVLQESIRGVGYSFISLLVNIFANIVLRLIYLYFIYPALKIVENVGYNLGLLYALYPASWTIGSIVATVVLVLLFNKVKNNFAKEKFAVQRTAEQESIVEHSTEEQVSAN